MLLLQIRFHIYRPLFEKQIYLDMVWFGYVYDLVQIIYFCDGDLSMYLINPHLK